MRHTAPTVLLAEDSPDDRFLIERAVRRSQLEVSLQVVTDGEQAIEYLAGHGPYADRERYPMPRLLLLDWKMSRADGAAVLGWVRARSHLDALPVVILTASREDADLQAAFAAHANSFLQKPGASADMLALVQSTLTYWLQHNLGPTGCCATP